MYSPISRIFVGQAYHLPQVMDEATQGFDYLSMSITPLNLMTIP